MIDRMIVDADLCIKLGGSIKYRFLCDLLPQISGEVYTYTRVRRGHGAAECCEPAVGTGR